MFGRDPGVPRLGWGNGLPAVADSVAATAGAGLGRAVFASWPPIMETTVQVRNAAAKNNPTAASQALVEAGAFYPLEADWKRGERTVTCYAYRVDQKPMTSSMKHAP